MTIINVGGGGGGKASYYIRMRITGSAGSPDLSGVTVTATASGRPTATGQTDSTGECYLEVKAATTYTVQLSKTNYVFSPASQQVTTDEPVKDLTATCYVRPKITVNVGGVDVNNRTITLTPQGGGSPLTKSTGSGSSVTFEGLEITTYTITCDYPAGQGVSPASDTQVTAAGGSYTKSFTVLSKPSLTVTVDSATGNVSNRTIAATPSSGSTVTAQTNGSGVATLTLMAGVAYTVACDSPSGYFAVSSQQTNLAAGADSDMSFTLQRKPQVTVTVTDASGGGNQSGRTVQMSNGSDTQTQTTSSGGTCNFVANGTGSYTFTITNIPEGASVATVTQSLAADGVYNVAMTISFGWLVSMTFNPSTFKTDPTGCLVYADDAVGMTPVSNTKTSLGTVSTPGSWLMDDSCDPLKDCYYATFDGNDVSEILNPNNLKQTKEGDASHVTSLNTMFVIPKRRFIGAATKLSMTNKDDAGGEILGHIIDSHEYNNMAIAVYPGINQSGTLKSLSGVTPTRSQNRATFRNQARANGTNWMLTNWYHYQTWRFMVFFAMKSFDGQRKIGQGYSSGGSSNYGPVTGQCDAMGPFAGNVSGITQQVKALIEQPWGGSYWFIDDMYNGYVGRNSVPTDDTANKTNLNFPSFAGVYPSAIRCQDAVSWAICSDDGGSDSTGLCDYWYSNFSSYPCPYVGGHARDGSNCGPSCVSCYAVSHSSSNIGARLAFVFD